MVNYERLSIFASLAQIKTLHEQNKIKLVSLIEDCVLYHLMHTNDRNDILEWIFEQNPDESLCLTAYHGCLQHVRYLINNGANINTGNDYPLRWASRNGK